jgi:hypothetical protein
MSWRSNHHPGPLPCAEALLVCSAPKSPQSSMQQVRSMRSSSDGADAALGRLPAPVCAAAALAALTYVGVLSCTARSLATVGRRRSANATCSARQLWVA